MRRKLLMLVLAVAAMLTVFGAAYAESAASTASDPLKLDMTLSTNRFTEPKEITVSISITNTGDTDMERTVTLYYPDGTMIEEFGSPTLSAGATKPWTGTWKVTQAQLEAGRITFVVEYYLRGDDGELMRKRKSFSKKLIFEGPQTATVIKRRIEPEAAGKGDTVKITYEIANTGNVDITDITVTENSQISKKSMKIGTVKPGEMGSCTFEVKMGTKDLTSTGEIRYKAAGKEYTELKEAQTIRYGEIKLSAKLSMDGSHGGVIGEKATLKLVLKNDGTLAFTDIKVTDPTLGEVFTDVSLPAGESVTLTREVPIETTVSYQFYISAKDETGVQTDISTDSLKVTAVDPSEVPDLSLTAESDRSKVYELPTTVIFKVSVTNNSDTEMTDVTVYAGSTQVYSFAKLAAHETKTFERELAIEMKGNYQFSARVKDKLNAVKTFTSNNVYISKETAPTPVPTEAPMSAPRRAAVTPTHTPLPDMETYRTIVNGDSTAEAEGSADGKLLRTLGLILLIPALVGGVLVMIGLINRIRAGVASHAALDHLQVNGTRDYELEGDDEEQGEEEPPMTADPEPAQAPQDEAQADPYQPEIDDEFERRVSEAVRKRQLGQSGEDR